MTRSMPRCIKRAGGVGLRQRDCARDRCESQPSQSTKPTVARRASGRKTDRLSRRCLENLLTAGLQPIEQFIQRRTLAPIEHREEFSLHLADHPLKPGIDVLAFRRQCDTDTAAVGLVLAAYGEALFDEAVHDPRNLVRLQRRVCLNLRRRERSEAPQYRDHFPGVRWPPVLSNEGAGHRTVDLRSKERETVK